LPDLSQLNRVKPANRKYLTRDELAKQYGSDPDAVTRIESFAKSHNLIVTRHDPASARIGLAGTVANVSAAFGVKLFDYTNPALGQFHARTGPVHVPEDIANDVFGVFGLNLHRKSRRSPQPADLSHKSRAWFIPSELAPIYDFPQANASGQCIGLLEFGGGVSTDDVTAYFAKIDQPSPTVTIVPVDGASTDPDSNPDDTGEVMLDVDVAGSLGAGAKLAVYFATFDEKGLVAGGAAGAPLLLFLHGKLPYDEFRWSQSLGGLGPERLENARRGHERTVWASHLRFECSFRRQSGGRNLPRNA
jgi:kumamolisin